MEILVKVEYSEDLVVPVDEICNEEIKVYEYGYHQLVAIRKALFDIIDNPDLSSEDEEKTQNALRIVQDYLYIHRMVPLKMLNPVSLKVLQNEDLTEIRNSLIRILNQHILMYHETLLPLYSRMIDVCASSLIAIRDEMELRGLNPYLTKQETKQTQHNIANIGKNYPIASF